LENIGMTKTFAISLLIKANPIICNTKDQLIFNFFQRNNNVFSLAVLEDILQLFLRDAV